MQEKAKGLNWYFSSNPKRTDKTLKRRGFEIQPLKIDFAKVEKAVDGSSPKFPDEINEENLLRRIEHSPNNAYRLDVTSSDALFVAMEPAINVRPLDIETISGRVAQQMVLSLITADKGWHILTGIYKPEVVAGVMYRLTPEQLVKFWIAIENNMSDVFMGEKGLVAAARSLKMDNLDLITLATRAQVRTEMEWPEEFTGA